MLRDLTIMMIGISISYNLQGLYHDFIGEEASRKLYENSVWISSWKTVPLHIIGILFCVYFYNKIK